MKRLSSPGSSVLLLLTLLCSGAAALALPQAWCEDSAPALEAAGYQLGEQHPGGIGRYYMGREIAEVMGHQAADWLDRPGREKEENPATLITLLGLHKNQVVADIGAGSGYYSLRIAPLVERVEAVDIQPEMLELVRGKALKQGVTNIETVLGTVSDPHLRPASIDVALLVDVYHEFDHPREMMIAIRDALRPDGIVVQVEFRAEDASVPIKTLHKMSEEQARREMKSFGLVWKRTVETLPWQHVLIYGH